jgi:glycosyltransferase involved in cell wall biosynthesis
VKIAIAATGLDHVKRGVESWAASLAAALADRGSDVTLFKGSGIRRHDYEQVLASLPRNAAWNDRLLAVTSRLGGWRYGLGSDYHIEQVSAFVSLLFRLKRTRYDVVHTQDALLASLLQRSANAGWHPSKIIFANGTAEPLALMAPLPYVQELSPSYFSEHVKARNARGLFLVPNSVNVTRFAPGDRAKARRELGLPDDRPIVLSVGAIKGPRKRMDWLIREFARLSVDARLVIAGAVERETEALVEWAKGLLGDRLVILANRDHQEMPLVYQAADVFVLCAIDEVFGIAFLEAMATGVPCIGHHYAVTQWVIGGGGMTVDMARDNDLAAALQRVLTDETVRRDFERAARQRACETFSDDVVVAETVKMYRAVAADQSQAQALRQTLRASL